MFQFPTFARMPMDSVYGHSGSRDQRSFDSFPGLIAAFHALHRLHQQPENLPTDDLPTHYDKHQPAFRPTALLVKTFTDAT
jgi:hypothetical protein